MIMSLITNFRESIDATIYQILLGQGGEKL